jgi:hypothetical protein
VKAADIRAAARTYATTSPASLLWGNAIDMSASSFHTARALMILRAITGNIDRPGGDVIWVTPQRVRMKSQFVNSEMTGKLWLPFEQRHRILDGTRADKPLSPLKRILFPLLNRVIRGFYPKIVQRTSTRPMGAQLKILNALKSPTYPLCPVVHPPTFWKSIVTGEPAQSVVDSGVKSVGNHDESADDRTSPPAAGVYRGLRDVYDAYGAICRSDFACGKLA